MLADRFPTQLGRMRRGDAEQRGRGQGLAYELWAYRHPWTCRTGFDDEGTIPRFSNSGRETSLSIENKLASWDDDGITRPKGLRGARRWGWGSRSLARRGEPDQAKAMCYSSPVGIRPDRWTPTRAPDLPPQIKRQRGRQSTKFFRQGATCKFPRGRIHRLLSKSGHRQENFVYIRVIIHEPPRVSISDLLLTSSCLCRSVSSDTIVYTSQACCHPVHRPILPDVVSNSSRRPLSSSANCHPQQPRSTAAGHRGRLYHDRSRRCREIPRRVALVDFTTLAQRKVMSFTSNWSSTPFSSSPSSMASQPNEIGSAALSRSSSSQSQHEFSSCTQRKRSFDQPSAYISDEDLFGDDDAPHLSEPPPPPRPAEAFLAQPLLPPVTNARRSSSSSHKKSSGKHRVYFKT